MKKKYILYIIIASFFIVCISLLLNNKQDPPQMSVSCSIASVEEESATINWTVENLSDREISFEDGCFAQITLNKMNVPFQCKALTLAPGEEKSVLIKLTNLNSGTNNLIITSTCKEGTSATYKSTIEPEKEPY